MWREQDRECYSVDVHVEVMTRLDLCVDGKQIAGVADEITCFSYDRLQTNT